MKLTDTYNKSMKEIIEECDIVNQKIHTDDDGNIEAIEIKYRPKAVSRIMDTAPDLMSRGRG